MKFEDTERKSARDLYTENPDIGTLILPAEAVELSEAENSTLTSRMLRIDDTEGGQGKRRQVVFEIDSEIQDGETVAQLYTVDIPELVKILYEHKQYAAARGFSDAEMDVLRAVEFADATRVGVDEIMDSEHAGDLAESTIYKSLKQLQEKDLVRKVRPGVYEHVGP